MIPFILHWPSLFFSKVSNSRKKVLITPGLYFPNYCVTYLPRDISRDFNKCECVNLRRKELYYTANNQKKADKKKADYQGLEKSRADSAARSRDSYMKDPEKSCARSRERIRKRVELTVQHEAAKVTRTTWRRVAMIVLQGAVSIGVGTGGLGGQFPPNIMLCIKELTVIRD